MAWACFSLLLCTPALAFYLPGVAPRDYQDGEAVEVKVQNLDSVHTQLPFDYYALPFCRPDKIEAAAENLGEVLHGDDIQNSPYEVFQQQTEACKILCKKDYTEDEVKKFRDFTKLEYRVNWIMDNLPAGTKEHYKTKDPNKADVKIDGRNYIVSYQKGFPLGFIGGKEHGQGKGGELYLNNHHRLVIFYHTDPESFEGFRIVGFEVDAFSVNHGVNGAWKGAATKLLTCTAMSPVSYHSDPLLLSKNGGQSVIWTYDVRWDQSELKWASRWDLYLKMNNSQIHWFSIMNSMLLVVFLSGIVALVLLRTLFKDFRKYNEMVEMTEEEKEEDIGWKLVHGDVFRTPPNAGLLCTLVGTGTQLCAMALITLVFAAMGFLSPANRGGLMTALLVVFVLMGFFAGYHSIRLYLMFGLENWRSNATSTAVLFPGIVFAVCFVLNLLVWGQQSTGAIPFTTMLALLALWLCISYPLVIFGGFVASKRSVIEYPTRINNIPREIPEVPWYNGGFFIAMLGGTLPFGAIFMELFFILTSVWQHRFYYVFGFLALVFLILVITTAEVGIVLTYFQLTSADYRWWWRSFTIGASTALYVFLNSIYYFVTKIDIVGFVPTVLYFGYTLLGCMTLGVLTGTISFLSTLWFVRKIYSIVKID